jgi:hypothetical protein
MDSSINSSTDRRKGESRQREETGRTSLHVDRLSEDLVLYVQQLHLLLLCLRDDPLPGRGHLNHDLPEPLAHLLPALLDVVHAGDLLSLAGLGDLVGETAEEGRAGDDSCGGGGREDDGDLADGGEDGHEAFVLNLAACWMTQGVEEKGEGMRMGKDEDEGPSK